MVLNVTEHIDGLSSKLASLSKSGRIAFAAWSCELLSVRARDFLRSRAGGKSTDSVDDLLNLSWQMIVDSSMTDREPVNQLEQALSEIDWDEKQVTDDEDVDNFCAVEALNSLLLLVSVIKEDSSGDCARAAESVINWIDFSLSREIDESYSEEVFSHPRMQGELSRQFQMIEFLTQTESIDQSDRNRFNAEREK